MAEGRALDNTTNINYLLQDYSTSIEYFDKRLTIAKECNDQIGQRRAHTNLGNAYLYLEDFDRSLAHYREAMTIGEVMNDGLFVAQINFIIGRVYDIKQEYQTSVYFHEKHLNLARQFQDSKGQCRAYFLLSQLYEKINQNDKAKKYLNLYKTLAREVDKSNEGKTNLLKNLRAESISVNLTESPIPHSTRSSSMVPSPTEEKFKKLKLNFIQHLTRKSPLILRKQASTSDPEELVDLVCRMQKSRFDDQRTHFPQNPRLSPLNEHFFDQLAKSQESRMNDQRAVLLPLPIADPSSTLRSMITTTSVITTPTTSQTKNFFDESTSKTLPDEDFFSLLNRLQTRQTSLSSTIHPRIKS